MTSTDDTHVATMRDHWEDLVAVAMLGTDRRNPPPAPDPIGDVVDDTVRERSSARMLAQVAAAVAARRAGVLPAPPLGRVGGPPHDDRPTIVPAAAERWYHITSSWPVLEDEWMLTVVTSGRRLPPELVPDVLARHRTDPVRRARAVAASGPLAAWLVDRLPDQLDGAARRMGDVDPESVGELPELPIPADLAPLLSAAGTSAGKAIVEGIERGALAHAHRAVLVNVIARMRPDALTAVHHALARFPAPGSPGTSGFVDASAPGSALASALAELAVTRRQMLDELS